MDAYAKAQPLLKNLTYDPTAVYDDAWLKDTRYDSAGGWLQNVVQSVGEGLYKEAIGSSDEVPEWLSALAEIAYEMYEERREEKDEESWLKALMRLFMD